MQSLEQCVESYQARESQMKQTLRSLEQEKASFQKTIQRMRQAQPSDLSDVELTHIKPGSNGKAKTPK